MFQAKTRKLENLAKESSQVVEQLEVTLAGPTMVYIDYANVRPWSNKLKWHIDLKRLKQFFDSFDTVQVVNFYNGLLEGDERSEQDKKEVEENHYVLRSKPVKIMQHSIDASSIARDSTALLDHFIRRALLRRYQIGTIEYLNERFADMNARGEYVIEDRKCNFDVEIGVDMLLDCERNKAEIFVLWSGDSDFADPVTKLMLAGKKVVLFATAGKVSKELSALGKQGLFIFDIQKIRNLICWNKEIESKRDPGEGAPKL